MLPDHEDVDPDPAAVDLRIGWDLVQRDWYLRQGERGSEPGGRGRLGRLVEVAQAVARGLGRLLMRANGECAQDGQ